MGNACCSSSRSKPPQREAPTSIASKDSEDWDEPENDAQQICLPEVSQCRNMISRIMHLAQANPNFRLLDVGCGNGLITVDLARAIQPPGSVTGLDISGGILETAKAYATHSGVENVQFVTGDAHRLPFHDDEFDAVHTHQAVSHFRDPVTAFKELLRVTKTGGRLCLREGNLSTAKFSPGYSSLDECFKVIIQVHEENGSSSNAGDMLPEWAAKVGVSKLDMVQSRPIWRCVTLKDRQEYGGHWPARCTQGLFADKAMELGVSAKQLQHYASEWKRWMRDPDASLSMYHGELVAVVN